MTNFGKQQKKMHLYKDELAGSFTKHGQITACLICDICFYIISLVFKMAQSQIGPLNLAVPYHFYLKFIFINTCYFKIKLIVHYTANEHNEVTFSSFGS